MWQKVKEKIRVAEDLIRRKTEADLQFQLDMVHAMNEIEKALKDE